MREIVVSLSVTNELVGTGLLDGPAAGAKILNALRRIRSTDSVGAITDRPRSMHLSNVLSMANT